MTVMSSLFLNPNQKPNFKSMKNVINLVGAGLIGVALTSCGGGGLDEATTTAINDFDSSWTAAMTAANDWVTTAQAEVAKWDADHAQMDADMATWSKEKKEANKAYVEVCHAVSGKGNTIIADAQGAIAGWTAATEEWNTWKKSTEDGDVTQEDATAGLESWNGRLAEVNAAMDSWDADWSALATEHTAAEDAMKGAM
jgi:hypothetical protein